MRAPWLPLGAFTYGLLSPAAFAADTLARACAELSGGRQPFANACEKHAKLYEVEITLVRACARFDPDVEHRLRCLRTGANAEIFARCRATGWSLDAQLSCLRSYPTRAVLRFCRSEANEEEQVRCVREGRER